MGTVLILVTSPLVVCISLGAWSLPANTALDGCIARPVRHFRRCLQLAAAKGKFQLEKSTPSFLLPCKSRVYHQVWMLLRSTFSPWAKADLFVSKCFSLQKTPWGRKRFWINLKPTRSNRSDLGDWNNWWPLWSDGSIWPWTEVQMLYFKLKQK